MPAAGGWSGVDLAALAVGAVPSVHGVVVMCREVIRQRDGGDWTFVTCLGPDGRVQLLMRPHAVDEDGTPSRVRTQVFRFSPLEVRALVACLDILPDDDAVP